MAARYRRGGKLTYHVSDPFGADGAPFDGVRVISKAAQPAVKVKAVVYSGEPSRGRARDQDG